MFQKASIKLASFYLAILMAISLFFSATLYQSYVSELSHGLRQSGNMVELEIRPGLSRSIRDQILEARERQYEEAKDRILARLFLLNIFILVAGGLLSYYLARRTLDPIAEAHDSLERFTADASHELRTPITAMRAENEVALMDSKLTLKTAKLQLQSNIEELDKLTALAEGLLRLSQLDNNGLVRASLEPEYIVGLAIDRILPLAEKKRIIVAPEILTNRNIMGDHASIVEVLVILLDNAVKYSPVQSEISLQVTDYQKFIQVVIHDNGPGIKASELPHIFERFYRADSSRTKQHVEGYGLGLAIAKRIADAHNGTLTAQSKIGQGCTFMLCIPAA